MLDNLSAFVDARAAARRRRRRPRAYMALVALPRRRHHRSTTRATAPRARMASSRRRASSSFVFCGWASCSWRVYGLLFGVLHPGCSTACFRGLTREVTVERTPSSIRVVLYLRLRGCSRRMQPDVRLRQGARGRRGSPQHARRARRGAPFLRRNGAAVGLYLPDVTLFSPCVAVVRPRRARRAGSGWSMWLGFAIGQVYVLARLWVKLVFWASETALFQGRLAHAGYVAAPRPQRGRITRGRSHLLRRPRTCSRRPRPSAGTAGARDRFRCGAAGA